MRRLLLSLAWVVTVCACSLNDEKEPPPCVPDATEPNESPAEATSLGTIQDDDELGQGSDAPPNKVTKWFSSHVAGDVDWFTLNVRDTGLGGNPKLSVIVGEGHEATAFWSCTNGPTESVTCGSGTAVTEDPDLPGARGCVTAAASGGAPQLTMQIECSGTPTDSGVLRIRVKRTAEGDACQFYPVTVIAD